ncbi:MAG: phosphatase PAP2 family protein [Chitinophagaceae bacterium]|nr:phosphatase PAP2 family protein [Chitinophagaceae bacterium]
MPCMKYILLLITSFYFDCTQAQYTTDPLQANDSTHLTVHGNKSSGTPITTKSLIVPSLCLAYGFVALHNHNLIDLNHSTKAELREDHPHFLTHVDNYLQFSPGLAVFGLNALGIKGKNNFRDRSIIYGLTTLLSTAIVFPIKNITKVQRPDKSGFNSFPSGHTTMAFASAEFLRQEYKDVSPWYGIAGYTVAAATGALRMYNNKHWLSDVVAGAGLGILSTRLVYAVYPSIKRKLFKDKPVNSIVMPYYQQHGGGLAYVHYFGN